MARFKRIILWGLGVIILALLIQFPIQQVDSTWQTWSLPLSGKTIVIDPGHGGADGGAVGKDETLEKDVALEVAKKARDFLQQSGALVYLTREEDKDLAPKDTEGLSRRKAADIRKRLAFIHNKEADFFITVHLNALSSEKWHGAQTFYYPKQDKSKHLAEMIQSEIIRNLENTTREPLTLNNVYLLKHAEVPGALVELGFLSNEHELERLKQDAYQRKMAGSIYQGILRYITEESEQE
ncbi:germination-specific N-acetylmuramoyl-L-alanine amidase [Lentibacillus kapialis]|uniref:Germination-specific N-acetylmuramoyl-L-alanine amidase n=1 Tax=Lentibacillus kapialis TaxID=340214 RepID=A0A917PYH4_9BACI|nr:N-acetylmuramoyl-L-alanine amidase CwlD [Lentibacillus kapialis]GGJ98645.1 germination-specific N-acetylmuramoyl-L-alanine amidase [Lentibacillus kapialis]